MKIGNMGDPLHRQAASDWRSSTSEPGFNQPKLCMNLLNLVRESERSEETFGSDRFRSDALARASRLSDRMVALATVRKRPEMVLALFRP
jgi:hypothetical protein